MPGPSRAAARRRPCRLRLLVAVLAGVVVACLAAATALCVFPRSDEPATSDVLVVLGPPLPARTALAAEMMRQGRAKEVVVSTYGDRFSPRVPLCEDPQPFRVTCFVADPPTTRGEAQQLGRLARERGWSSMQAVTFGPHVNRARIIVGRCFAGDLRVVQAADHVGPVDLAHHVAGWLKLATYWSC